MFVPSVVVQPLSIMRKLAAGFSSTLTHGPSTARVQQGELWAGAFWVAWRTGLCTPWCASRPAMLAVGAPCCNTCTLSSEEYVCT